MKYYIYKTSQVDEPEFLGPYSSAKGRDNAAQKMKKAERDKTSRVVFFRANIPNDMVDTMTQKVEEVKEAV